MTASEPRVGTLTQLTGTSYAVIMIDLDIPTNSPPKTSTLLHWMQTGLTPATSATQLNTTSGAMSAFLLENAGGTAAAAPYIGPNPPARIPLSHRYTQILVDTSGLSAQGAKALQAAAQNRSGFDAPAVLAKAGLKAASVVVAGNSFNVTNPGPVMAASAGGGGGAGAGAGMGKGAKNGTDTATGSSGAGGNGGGRAKGTGTMNTNGPKASKPVTSAAGAEARSGSVLVAGLGMMGVFVLGL